MAIPEEKAAYEAMVKKRIEKPLLRDKRDFKKLTKTLTAEEVALATGLADEEQRRNLINDTYQRTLEEYKTTISVFASITTLTKGLPANLFCHFFRFSHL